VPRGFATPPWRERHNLYATSGDLLRKQIAAIEGTMAKICAWQLIPNRPLADSPELSEDRPSRKRGFAHKPN
jgi:hypothetical protein